MAVIVRPPTLGDIAAMVDMGARLHAESAYAFLPYDRNKTADLACSCIERPHTRCALIAEDRGRPIGMLAGYLTEYYFCEKTLACDWLVFVERERRGGPAALRLIQRFQQWAAERGAREVCLGVSTGVGLETVDRLYRRLGFVHVGGNYKRRL